ncbi:Transcriptional regulatory protein ZraR [bacterium HR10]|nr:Transcriptional regulatory protein ZraR [bacterium HR10]
MSEQVVQRPLIAHGPMPRSGDESDITKVIEERLVGVSRWATEARAAVAAHAAHDHPILIEGEPGAGKEFVARLIHECSARRHGPFVAFSCESLSERSIEAALFGSIRELPSGGNRVQRGLVERARGGTLYISGISTLSPLLKTEIARLIQYQEFRRQGDGLLETADVRVILGSTPTSPSSSGMSGALEGTALTLRDVLIIPPLRQRRADIEPLSRHFVKEVCQRLGKELRGIAPDTLAWLRRYDWPGNVGELKAVIEDMVRRSRPPCLDPSLLPAHLLDPLKVNGSSLPASGINLREELERLEKSLLCAALRQCQGRQTKAAELLGLKRTTLNTKLKRYGIKGTSFK